MGRGTQALACLCSPTPFCLSWPPWLSLRAEGTSPNASALLPELRLPLSTRLRPAGSMPSPDSPGLGPPITEVGGARNTFTLTLDPAFATGFQSGGALCGPRSHPHPQLPPTHAHDVSAKQAGSRPSFETLIPYFYISCSSSESPNLHRGLPMPQSLLPFEVLAGRPQAGDLQGRPFLLVPNPRGSPSIGRTVPLATSRPSHPQNTNNLSCPPATPPTPPTWPAEGLPQPFTPQVLALCWDLPRDRSAAG